MRNATSMEPSTDSSADLQGVRQGCVELGRQAEGIAAAKKRGTYKGRPRSLESDQIRSVRNAALAGTPKAQIAREHGISRSTLYGYLERSVLLPGA